MNNEFHEKSLVEEFIKLLKEKKRYPDESIIQEMPLSDSGNKFRYQADLVLLDAKSKQYIGLVEFKRKIDDKIKSSAFKQVSSYLKLMGSSELHIFLVGTDLNNRLIIYILNSENEWEEIAKENFPNYEALSATVMTKKQERIKQNKEKNVDKFKLICLGLACGTFILFILSLCNIIKMNADEMALLGATVALIIIPYAAKLKILGVEFERNKD